MARRAVAAIGEQVMQCDGIARARAELRARVALGDDGARRLLTRLVQLPSLDQAVPRVAAAARRHSVHTAVSRAEAYVRRHIESELPLLAPHGVSSAVLGVAIEHAIVAARGMALAPVRQHAADAADKALRATVLALVDQCSALLRSSLSHDNNINDDDDDDDGTLATVASAVHSLHSTALACAPHHDACLRTLQAARCARVGLATHIAERLPSRDTATTSANDAHRARLSTAAGLSCALLLDALRLEPSRHRWHWQPLLPRVALVLGELTAHLLALALLGDDDQKDEEEDVVDMIAQLRNGAQPLTPRQLRHLVIACVHALSLHDPALCDSIALILLDARHSHNNNINNNDNNNIVNFENNDDQQSNNHNDNQQTIHFLKQLIQHLSLIHI